MPKSIAQWTGFMVTIIIVLGRDADVLTAIPLGIAAGMLATLFQAAMRMQLRPVRFFPGPRASRPQGRLSLRDAAGTAAVPGMPRLLEGHRALVAIAKAIHTYRPKRRHAQFRE